MRVASFIVSIMYDFNLFWNCLVTIVTSVTFVMY